MAGEWEILPFGQEIGAMRAEQLLGFLPQFLSVANPDKAREQLNQNYRHGGGWRPMEGWHLQGTTKNLSYPGDPVYKPLAKFALRDEEVYVYPYAWVAIVQADGSFEVARID